MSSRVPGGPAEAAPLRFEDPQAVARLQHPDGRPLSRASTVGGCPPGGRRCRSRGAPQGLSLSSSGLQTHRVGPRLDRSDDEWCEGSRGRAARGSRSGPVPDAIRRSSSLVEATFGARPRCGWMTIRTGTKLPSASWSMHPVPNRHPTQRGAPQTSLPPAMMICGWRRGRARPGASGRPTSCILRTTRRRCDQASPPPCGFAVPNSKERGPVVLHENDIAAAWRTAPDGRGPASTGRPSGCWSRATACGSSNRSGPLPPGPPGHPARHAPPKLVDAVLPARVRRLVGRLLRRPDPTTPGSAAWLHVDLRHCSTTRPASCPWTPSAVRSRRRASRASPGLMPPPGWPVPVPGG